MMKKYYFLLFILFLIISFNSCDSGNIYPPSYKPSGRSIKVEVSFRGLDAWPNAYNLVLATWGTDDKTPISSVIVQKPQKDGDSVTIKLDGINNDVQKISVSVINKGRSLLYTFKEITLTNDVDFDMGEINVAEMERIQSQVFNNYCTRCHGAGNTAAAGLYLTDNKAHDALVGVLSKKSKTGKMLVVPSEPEKSFILDVLTSDILGYNHTDVLPENELVTLIRTWIKQGAKD